MIDFFLLAACHYSSPDLTAERLEEKIKDSLTYLFRCHYTWNTNLGVLDDPVRLEYLPVKDTHVSLSKGDRAVVTEFSTHPQDNVGSIWVKLAHLQDVQGQVRNRGLVRSFVPTDSISQFIHLFSNTRAPYFVIVFALFVGACLLRVFIKKRLQMIYFNDIDSVYPFFLYLLMVFSATVYGMMQVFAPDTWEHFYFNPALSPFKVPFILSAFLLSVRLFIVVTLAVLDDLFHQLTPAAAVFYLPRLMSYRILCYFFFILTAHIYVGYLFLACFIWLFVEKMHRSSGYKYHCGGCRQRLREEGVCPRCGAIDE